MGNSIGLAHELIEYECECQDNKKFRILFDGDSTGQYVIEFCQKCFDQDDKQFMISMEVLL
jgi:hypothetical protein